MRKKKSLGICIGASSVSYAEVNYCSGEISIARAEVIAHNGDVHGIITKIFSSDFPDSVAVTGRKLRENLNLTSVSEAEASEYSLDFLQLQPDVLISAGGENFFAYGISEKGKISNVSTGNKCASGTGEFFLQQIKRMDLPLCKAVDDGQKGDAYNISGRCSVFCKSDCTHALNKGVPKEDVVAGLCRMMAGKITELTSGFRHKKAVIIGGVSRNKGVLRFLEKQFEEIIIPREAAYFEALGAALYALKNQTMPADLRTLFKTNNSAFVFHKPLREFAGRVSFRSLLKDRAREGDECIIGLDVGSTTTKIVLLRKNDNSVLASEYLRTNGDPVRAAIECYSSIQRQLTCGVKITGLGVTGSGRHIAGMHAKTSGVINEIVAHAAAAVYFDKDVDTIFEIGGQDAKYTHITAGVASDYAMNEACSAGTGSFLEEAALESLDVAYTEIGDMALRAENPPNFNDQCAAFIGSDIKNALHEGLGREDILAGLVYSICLNYTNRVKGNRPVGRKVFMQGGVCYNKAVPVAMAALTGKEIIVPPEPGLMGAFGVALEIKKRISLSLAEPADIRLGDLISRKVGYDKPFVCAGGTEKCDRKCSVNIIVIEGKKYPFGGACDKFYNFGPQRNKQGENLVAFRQNLVFAGYEGECPRPAVSKVVGIPKSFLSNTYFPFYYSFFTNLGFKVVIGDIPVPGGIEKRRASFCYPAELAHGFMQDLIDKKPDFIFLPHIKQMHSKEPGDFNKTCVLLQAESYYLRAAFEAGLEGIRLLSPVLDFSGGFKSESGVFTSMATEMGSDRKTAVMAFEAACIKQDEVFAKLKKKSDDFLSKFDSDGTRIGIVLFGRPYNAFAGEANLGIPQKFSSRGIDIIPFDMLPCEDMQSYNHMYWGAGQQILRAARFVKNHPRLFAVYITNFSCGPDSFIIGYFRNIMAEKPSLTLELDSHSADAGINTRIEAALDIVKSYRELEKAKIEHIKGTGSCNTSVAGENAFRPLKMVSQTTGTDSCGRNFSIFDKDVKMIIPSMGRIGTEALAAAFASCGLQTEALPVYSMNTLASGRGCSSCKECLPLQLNAGAVLEYEKEKKNKEEKTLLFMAKGNGPCRLGQYHVFLEDMIVKKKIADMGIFTLSDENSYTGLGNSFTMRGWAAVVISDTIKDIYSAIIALACDKTEALNIFESEWVKILDSLRTENLSGVYRQLRLSALKLRDIELDEPYSGAKKVALLGEIFVRHDEFSKLDLVDRLSGSGFIVKSAPVGEYIYYSNYLSSLDCRGSIFSSGKIKLGIRDIFQRSIERKVRYNLSLSGLSDYSLTDVKSVISEAGSFINPALEGEAILTVGAGLHEMSNGVCGIIAIAPFSCMPSRVAEAVLAPRLVNMPYLAVETDGNPYPQIIQSKIEIFMIQAERLHSEKIKRGDKARNNGEKIDFQASPAPVM